MSGAWGNPLPQSTGTWHATLNTPDNTFFHPISLPSILLPSIFIVPGQYNIDFPRSAANGSICDTIVSPTFQNRQCDRRPIIRPCLVEVTRTNDIESKTLPHITDQIHCYPGTSIGLIFRGGTWNDVVIWWNILVGCGISVVWTFGFWGVIGGFLPGIALPDEFAYLPFQSCHPLLCSSQLT